MNEEPLVIPLTVHFRDDEASPSYTTVSSAFARCQPTCLTSWNLGGSQVSANRSGAAIGCQDGSIYLLRHVHQRVEPATSPTSPGPATSPTSPGESAKFTRFEAESAKSPSISIKSPVSHRFHAKLSLRPTPTHSALVSPLPSRPPSPSSITSASSSTAPMHITSRTRAVSALSRASAQAPKNYVDFEEEEHKLRGMLDRMGHREGHKEKGLLDVVLPTSAITEPDEKTKHHVEKLVEDHPHTVRSVPNLLSSTLHITATAPTPEAESRYASTPTSPGDVSSPSLSGSPTFIWGTKPNLELSQHIFPAGIQNGGSITALLSLASMHFVSLSSLGDINVLSSIDGGCVAATAVSDASAPNGTLRKIWEWRAMDRMRISEGDVLILRGCEIVSDDVDSAPATRVVALKLELNDVDAVKLKQVGDWSFDEPFSRVGSFSAEDGTPVVYILKPTSELLLHPLTTSKALPSTTTSAAQSTAHLPLSLPISLPNPFKVRAPLRSVEGLNEDALHADDLTMGDPVHVGTLAQEGTIVRGLRVGDRGRGVLWDDLAIEIFQVGFALRRRRRIVHPNVDEAALLDGETVVVYKKGTLQVAKILLDQSRHKDADSHDQVDICRLNILQTVKVNSYNLWRKVEGCTVLCLLKESTSVKLRMVTSPRGSPSTVDDVFSCELPPESQSRSARRITCLRPIELGTVTVGYSDGFVGRSSVSHLLFPERHPAGQVSDRGLDGFITSLHPLPKVSKDALLVAGADDGGVGIWGLAELDLRARWIMFATPLVRAVPVEEGYVGLHGCVVCVSEDGTVGFVQTNDSIELLYVIPSASASLLRVCLSEDNLVFLYDNGRARLWDAKTREFWRLMDTNKAEELMEHGGWFLIDVHEKSLTYGVLPLRELPPRWISTDAGATLLLDIRGLDKFTSRPSVPLPHLPKNGLRNADDEMPLDEDEKSTRLSDQLHLVLPLLSVLFTFGIDEQIDNVCTTELSVPRQQVAVSWGQHSPTKGLVIPEASQGLHAWQISAAVTTYRLLAIITVLRVCLSYEDFERYAATVIAFYAVSLADVVPSFQPPSLDLLVHFWYDASSDIQQAARTLFGAVLPRMSNEEVIDIAERWQRRLPCLQPDAERDSVTCARALTLTGNIAVEKYALLSTSTLRDISKSLALYLHDQNCPHSVLAIDLCSRGFNIWQNYIDPMDALRCLFHRATDFRKDAPPGAGNHARQAILQVASSNTALFVTTISLDILSARSAEHHKSVMLIVAFIVRKRPLVLYPSLPRLVDAVVTSLDPNSSSRDAIIQAATVILDQLVMTYPSIAFSQLTQRLAVGTNEGAVIMFDLKTATRLYVLEGHRKRVSACSFSPDGRRLITVSLEESVVLVWKVGSSFSNLFNPGGPPRQGHSGTAPYKTLPFNLGERTDMSALAQLELITFDWPADRSAKLKIKDSTFTFNT